MAYFNGPTLIEPPQAPMPPVGIFSVALGPMPFPAEAAQGGGVMYVPNDCEDDVFLLAMDCPPTTGAKTFSALEAPISGAPFTVMTSYTCGSIGYSFPEVEQRVRLRMQLREQRGVEKRIWGGSTGVLGSVPSLFANAISLGNAACITEAVEMLEQTLADNAVLDGIIHARPGMGAHFAEAHLLDRNGPGKAPTTLINTRVVFGQGYAGTGPSGGAVSTDSEWIYATGRVVIWAGDTFVSDPGMGLNRTTNQLYVLAERTFAVAIECGIWAVQVTRNCTTAGGT
jgi:hypothetical protein